MPPVVAARVGAVRMNTDECWERLRTGDHGVLSTVHPARGVDAVPVVYGVTDDDRLVLPIDTVKPKSTTKLQRLANLDADSRCVLLVDHYDDDWSTLWWVRVHGTAAIGDAPAGALDRFAAYRAPGAVAVTIVLTPTEITGWSA